ncbi:MAG: hypothetical protein Q8O64_16230, partial [Sideroxyarcus sp.]|nr:hypothetical protein [Sideroxyarcus sp.]
MNEIMRSIGISAVLGIAIVLSWLQPLDTTAINQVDDGLKRALASYAVARTLNAVISVAQGTEVSVQIGVGATFTPGQVLDPVNDLVEQFGDLMLAASVAFGIMHILIKIGSFWLFSLVLTVSASAWLWMRWRNISSPEWLMKVVIVLLFARFSFPIVTVGSDLAFKQFLADDYSRSQSAIQLNSDEISTLGNDIEAKDAGEAAVAPPAEEEALEPPKENGGMLNKLSNSWNSLKATAGSMKNNASEALQIKERMSKLRQSAGQLVEHVVKLIVVFILQTIIIPIVILWLLYRA